MTGPAGSPPPLDPSGAAPGGVGQGSPGGYARRSERRSSRRNAERRHRSERLGRGILPALLAIVVVVAVMVLWSPLVPAAGESPSGRGSTTTVAATVPPAVPSVTVTTGGPAATSGPATTTATTAGAPTSTPGSALLVVKQDGNVALVALFCAGPKGGVVLGLPGITLLRSGDRFVPLAQAYSPDSPAALAQSIAGALAVPLGAVAAIEWSDLRAALASAAVAVNLPEGLDQQGADAGAISAVLAALLNGGNHAGAAGAWWGQAALQGETDAFRAALAAEIALAAGKPWAGQALTGTVVNYGDGAAYLEPDLQKASGVLSGTGTGN
jgi:hypothetical protein